MRKKSKRYFPGGSCSPGLNPVPFIRRTGGPLPHCVLPRVLTVNSSGDMKQKENAPGTRSERAGANNGTGKYTQFGNDVQISFGYHQRRVYNFLLQGGSHSVADISAALRLSDPRSSIRDLRAKGVAIADVWCDGEHGGRFKRYFIQQDNTGKEVQR